MKFNYLAKFTWAWLVVSLGLLPALPVKADIACPSPLFQYAVFYNGLMEFTDCAPLSFNGYVHGNSDIYVGCPNSSSLLTFNDLATSSGTITNPSWFGYQQNSYLATNINYKGTPAPGYRTGDPQVMLPMGADSNSPSAIIQLPTTIEDSSNPSTNLLSQQRYYYKAMLQIFVTNITTSLGGAIITNVLTKVIIKGSMFDVAPLVFSYTNNLPTNTGALMTNFIRMNTNWAWFGASNWLTTNTVLWDARQGRTNHITQIDVGKFGFWMATNNNPLIAAKWNASNPFNGIIYVADMRATNGMYMNSVRLTNGQTIPSIAMSNNPGNSYTIPGLTVATINSLYIAGLYNCPGTNNQNSTNTIGTRPCSVVCDALTILSTNWTDTNSFRVENNSLPTPTASVSDTVNIAIIAGDVPSTGPGATQFGGGVQNLPRLLENWSSCTLYLNTSLINLYPSAQATAQFQAPGIYYDAPTRRFSFDLNFKNSSLLPPGTPLISKIPATVAISNNPVTITTTPPGLNVNVTYNGSSVPPSAAGTYLVSAVVDDPVYGGSATNSLDIEFGPVTVTLGNLSQTYDGTAKSASVSTIPPGVATLVTYNGSTTLPVGGGSYVVVAVSQSPGSVGGATNTLVISQAVASVTLTNLSQTYSGGAIRVSAITVPAKLATNVTYNGLTNAPINAGSYTVVCNVNDPNYLGSATGTLVITRAEATTKLDHLLYNYDGSYKIAGYTTSPAGLNVLLSYDGSSNAPTNAGSYLVVGIVDAPNYQGGDTNTLVITQAAAALTFSNLAQTYDGTAKTVSGITDPSNLVVTVTYDGSTNAPTNAGSYFIAGNIADLNYQGSATNTLVISPAVASVTMSNLSQTFDGTPKSVLVTTMPPGLVVDLTYAGSTNAPTNAGSYLVIGAVDDINYQGSATNTLVIVPTTPVPTPITLSGTTLVADGTFQLSFTNTPGASFTVLGSLDPTTALTNWTVLGSVIEVAPGQFQFTDAQSTNGPKGFYMIRSP